MKVFIFLQALTGLLAAVILSSCSVKFEAGYHGQTGRDDRVISQGLYPEGVTQQRKADQRY